jgi:two-component system chemotaxis response regulator CheB
VDGAAQRSLPAIADAAGARHRVLVVDDSAVARAVLTRVIDATPNFAVAGVVGDADAARAFLLSNRVDIILLDIDMPGVSGLMALPDLLVAGRGARVLVVSSACDEGGATTIQALALGAADTLVKPGIGNFAGRFVYLLRERLERLAGVSAERGDGMANDQPRSGSVSVEQPFAGFAPAIMAVAASTGGIHALSRLLRHLPVASPVPMLITQHLPATFMPYFAAQVALLSGRPCEVAADRTRVLPGRIYVAPGHAHIRCVPMIEGAAIRLSDEAVASGCRPSADPMLQSVGDGWGPAALAVVLSGMGRDGAEGARTLKAAGGRLIAQDRETSVVWGMPGAVVRAGLADAVMPPDAIGRMIAMMGQGA